MADWGSIPDVVGSCVCSYLGFRDLLSMAQTCRTWRLIAADDHRWEELLSKDWEVTDNSTHRSCKEAYRTFQEKYGSRKEQYLRFRRSWAALGAWIEGNAPKVYSSLNPGLEDSEIAATEASLNIKLPMEFRLWLQQHNGQCVPKSSSVRPTPCMVLGQQMLPLDLAVHIAKRSLLPRHGLLPFAAADVVTAHFAEHFPLCIDVNTPNGRVVLPYDGGRATLLVCDSFLDWMERYSAEVTRGLYDVDQHTGGLDPYRFGSQHVTNGFGVQVSTYLVPERSCPPSLSPHHEMYFFAYRVRLTNAHPSHTYQLLSRKWVITDGHGKVEHVQGSGVVGNMPILPPQTGRYEYCSACPLPTRTGDMAGTYHILNDTTQDTFEATIAPFALAV